MTSVALRFPCPTANPGADSPARRRKRWLVFLISLVTLAAVPPIRAQVVYESITFGGPGQVAPWALTNTGRALSLNTDFFAGYPSFITAVENSAPGTEWRIPTPVPLLPLLPGRPIFKGGDMTKPAQVVVAINARNHAVGIDDHPFDTRRAPDTGEPITRGVDPAQFYAEQYFPRVGRGLDVKAGRFVFQFGADSADAPLSGFVSRAHNFIYGPLPHTGLLTTLRLTDAWSLQEGVVTDTDLFVAPTTDLTYFGSIKFAPPTGRNIVLVAYILGNGRFDQFEWPHDPKVFDLTFRHKFSGRLDYTIDALYGFTTSVPDTGFVNWWASVQYLSCILTPRVTAVGRLEFFDDVQGEFTGIEGLSIVPTVGLNVRPNRFVLIRPEFRLDYNTESRPYDGKHGVASTALGVVARW